VKCDTLQPSELLNQAWNKDKLKHRAPNIVACIARSTQLSYWVATMILSQKTLPLRTRMFEKMISIAKVIAKLETDTFKQHPFSV
jgi:hypothetical protein